MALNGEHSMSREIVLDTETTGFNPYSGDRLVEIGCLELINTLPTGNIFHAYINPQRDMPQASFEVHGLSEEFLKDKPLFKDVHGAFLDFIQDSPLVIHNAAFDMKFLNAELGWIGVEPIPFERAIDTLLIARRKFPGSPATLDALCKRFEVDNSRREKHGALLDAELLAEVYLELIGGRQRNLLEQMVRLDENKTSEKVNVGFKPVSNWPQRSFPLTDAEKERHKTFLETDLTDPIWISST